MIRRGDFGPLSQSGHSDRFERGHMSKSTEVELEVTVKVVTDKALLINDGKIDVWLPKSQISDWSGSEELDRNVTSVFVPEWLAIEKGLV